MTDNRKISEIYKETITAINELDLNMDQKEYKKRIEIIYRNKKLLGVIFNPRVMTHERIKELKIDILDNIEMVSRGRSLTSLEDLRMKLEEEPSFLEQFNFK